MAMNKRPRKVKIHQDRDRFLDLPSSETIDMAPNTKQRRKKLSDTAPTPKPAVRKPVRRRPQTNATPKARAPRETAPHTEKRRLRVLNGGVLERLRRHRRLTVLALIALVLVVTVVIGNAFVPAGLGEWMQNGFCTWGGGEGFPVVIEDDAVRDLVTRGSTSFVLTDSNLFAYSSAGKTVASVQHGYLTPVLDVSQTRTLVYDRGNTALRVDTFSRNLFSKEFEEEILTADLCDSGAIAVAFDDAEYASAVEVYNKNYTAVFRQSYQNETVTAVKLRPNGKTVAIATVQSQGGAFVSTVYLYQVSSGDLLHKETVQGSMIATLRSTGRRVFAASDETLLSVTWKGDSPKYYDVSGLHCLSDEGSNGLAVSFNPNAERHDTVMILNRKGEEVSRFTLDRDDTRLCLNANNLFVLDGDTVITYDYDGKVQNETQVGYEYNWIAPRANGFVTTADMKLQYHG